MIGARARLLFRLHHDHLYVDADAYAAHMENLSTVALLRDGGDLHVVPLIGPEGGGFLIKQINARGDRAIHAADFFRLHGVDETREILCEGVWDAATGAFRLPRLFEQASAF